MFQTEIIIFLQSFASDFFTSFFEFFTEVGRTSFVVPLIGIIMFGVNFRSGYILAHIVVWNGTITGYLKELFSLPRPANVDSTIQLLGKDYPNPTPFVDMGGKSFFGGLPRQIVEYLRANRIDSWGFPSGHASQAVALWGSIFLFFKKVWVRVLSIVFIIFIPLSRMYLGRHFLADVLGGLLLGFIIVTFFLNAVYKNEKLERYIFERFGKIQFDLKSILLIIYFLVIPFLILLVPGIRPEEPASFLGLNLGFLFLWVRGIPKDSGNFKQRIGRVLVAGFFYFGVNPVLEEGMILLFGSESATLRFIRIALSIFLLIWGSTEISIKLKFFKR